MMKESIGRWACAAALLLVVAVGEDILARGGGRGGGGGGGGRGTIRYSGGGGYRPSGASRPRPSTPSYRPSTPSYRPSPGGSVQRPSQFPASRPSTGPSYRPPNYGSILSEPGRPSQLPTGSGGYRRIEGPRGGEAVVGRGPEGGGGAVIKGPEGGGAAGIKGPSGGAAGVAKGPGGTVAGGIKGPGGAAAGGILGPGGSWAAGARGPGGGAAIAAKGPYGYRSYTRLPDGAGYIRWGGGSYWHHGWIWYRPYFYGGSVYYGEVPAPVGYVEDELPDKDVITTVVDGVTYYYYKGVFYIEKDGKYQVVEKPGAAQTTPASVDPQALECLRRMADFLGSIQAGSLTIRDTSDEILESGQKIQLESTRKTAFRVPNRLAVDFEDGNITRRVVYDGKTITLFEKPQNVYAQEPMPATLSGTMDTLASKYGMTIPAVELLRRGLMERLTPQLRSGEYLGTESVEGATCHHLAFSKEWVDVQIWVQDGEQPFPRKVVIVYKQIPGTPKYSMTLSDWSLANPPDSVFAMGLPADAKKVEMAPLDSAQ